MQKNPVNYEDLETMTSETWGQTRETEHKRNCKLSHTTNVSGVLDLGQVI